MRYLWLLICVGSAAGQAVDPAYQPLDRAYQALKSRAYDEAIRNFQQAIIAAPSRASIHTDLAYTYLKIGENVAARDQFHEAMQLEPADRKAALEYAFLCYETKEQAEARRVFDRIRKTGDATAEQAFQNIDRPLAAGIERWTKAIEMGADNFSAHFDLAQLAEQRDELALAAEHYEKAWRLAPDRRSVLVDLGRTWKHDGKDELANAALLAASRGGETRAAEMAKELLPVHYPYVPEFRKALELDQKNLGLRRELGFLLLKMNRTDEAEKEFRALIAIAPDDALAAAQLGFLLLAGGNKDAAMPLLQKVLDHGGEDLANRVRAVLHMPQVGAAGENEALNQAKEMAARSIDAGYLRDAVKYLLTANEADPHDYDVMFKLGWANNILHHDKEAYQWFDEARKSPDPKVAAEAGHAWRNLRPSMEPVRTSGWFYPIFSTRWHDQFGYAQIKTEFQTGSPLIAYVSVRFVGDTRQTTGQLSWLGAPQYLSESSVILGGGVRTVPWHGAMGWFEAGSAAGYLSGHVLPDYRGGVSFAKSFGQSLAGESHGLFADTTLDGVFVSRFGRDFLVYSQTRAGITLRSGAASAQLYWNGNITIDDQRQYWANYGETGPGIRFRFKSMPSSMFFTVNAVRGAYLINQGNVRGPNYNDVRAGMWYAFTR